MFYTGCLKYASVIEITFNFFFPIEGEIEILLDEVNYLNIKKCEKYFFLTNKSSRNFLMYETRIPLY